MGVGKPEPKNSKRKEKNMAKKIMTVAALVLLFAVAGFVGWKSMEGFVVGIEAAKERRER